MFLQSNLLTLEEARQKSNFLLFFALPLTAAISMYRVFLYPNLFSCNILYDNLKLTVLQYSTGGKTKSRTTAAEKILKISH